MRTPITTVYITKAIRRKLQRLKQQRGNRRLIDTLEQAVDEALESSKSLKKKSA